jgi:hypothetical protein
MPACPPSPGPLLTPNLFAAAVKSALQLSLARLSLPARSAPRLPPSWVSTSTTSREAGGRSHAEMPVLCRERALIGESFLLLVFGV